MRRHDASWKAVKYALDKVVVAFALLSFALPAAGQDKIWRVGLLSNGSSTQLPGQQSSWRGELLSSLAQGGYRLGRNLELVDRYSDGDVGRLPDLAREIAAASVDVVVAVSDPATGAMMAATQKTPIVMVVGDDPVAGGFVTSMARPGDRVTGLALQTSEGDVKRLQILSAAMPNARRFGRLGPPGQVPARAAELLMSAAGQLHIELTIGTVSQLKPTDYAAALAVMRGAGVAGLLIASSQAWGPNAPLVGRVAEEVGLPTICEWDYMARVGCTLAYGHDIVPAQRRIGEYAVRILKGAAPADLPVEQSDAWKLTINMTALARLGLTLPRELLVRADEVIE
jgi:putative tryptophan/tyrosine transport system substrate-binding protein